MKRLFVVMVLSLGALRCPPQLQAQAPNLAGTNLTGSAILSGLKAKQGEELHGLIVFLDANCDKLRLTDQEIDPIIEQLLAIQKTDPYQKTVEAFKDPTRREVTVFPNRGATDQCIFRFQFQKVRNALRRLPLDERVDKIIEGIEHPPKGFHFETVGSFEEELIRAGHDAVPFIVQHKPKESYHRRAVVGALAAIGDPRGIDYIIEVLNTPDDAFRFERPIAAKALAKFKDPRVVPALVKALQDETREDIDRHLPQVESPNHKPYIGRYYSVQHAAAQSLTELSGKDWGLLYNEDHRTWSSWRHSDHPDSFNPGRVERSDQETAKLIEYMFHRRMSARPNPWQPQNMLETPDGVRRLTADLKPLGTRVVPLVVDEYHARIKETPLWQDELRKWTRELLTALDWNNAKEAAQRFFRFYSG